MADQLKTVERTVRRPFFSYMAPLSDAAGEQVIGPDGRPRFYQKLAYKGDTISVLPPDAERGDKHGVFLQDGETLDDTSSAYLRLSDIGLLSDEQLRSIWADKPPRPEDVLYAVGENSDLAVKAITAENTTDKPRKTMLDKLQKIADGEGGDD